MKTSFSNRQLSLILGVTLILMAITSGVAFGSLHPMIFTSNSFNF